MLRRLYHDQPESFAFTPANLEWAEAQMTKYPAGRQASAVIPLLWRAQEQEGWLSRPAIEEVGRMLDMAYIRVLEVATFYFMFQLQPVGSVAHIQVCGTTSCMICGAEDLIAVCREKIAPRPHRLSDDGTMSWEEVECLGACANAPMAQIGKDYYEDLTAESFGEIIDRLAGGEVPVPGPQNGRFTSEPANGLTSLGGAADHERNASVALAVELNDTIKRIDGTEVSLSTPWRDMDQPGATQPPESRDDLLGPKGGIDEPTPGAQPSKDTPVSKEGITKQETDVDDAARPDEGDVAGTQSGPIAETDKMRGAGETGDVQGADRERLGGGDGPLSGGETNEASGSGKRSSTDAGRLSDGGETDAHGADDRHRGAEDGSPSVATDDGVSTESSEAANVAEGEERRPEALDGPRGGKADDLKEIKGVGPKLEELLHSLGFYHFDQIAGWSAREIAWVDRNLDGFKGRVIRDDWVGQARSLSPNGKTKS